MENYTLKLSNIYIGATLIVFSIEVLIALCVNDGFVRPYLGDTLAVVLVYCFLKIVIRDYKIQIAAISLAIAFSIEVLQAIHFIDYIRLKNNKLASIVLGSSFSWGDILAYIAGAVLIVIFDRKESI